METNRLKQFKVLVETGSMRRAAELLHISHGGLSKSIKQLEEELGIRLITPEGRGIRITEQGNRIYQKTVTLLGHIDEFISDAQPKKEAVFPLIKIGTFEVFSTYFLSPLLQNYLKGVSLVLREFMPGKLELSLLEREIDVGITYLPIPTRGVEYTKVTSVIMGTYTCRGAFRDISPEELPFVVPVAPVSGSPTAVKGLDGWPHLYDRIVRFQVDLMESAMQICRLGLAAVFIPDFIARLHNKVVSDKFHLIRREPSRNIGSIRRDVHVLTRQGYSAGRVMTKITAALRGL